MTKTIDTIVIGGGISGLTAAHFLRKAGLAVQLLEKKEKVGGVITTHRDGEFVADLGPNSSLETHPAIGELVEDLGLTDRRRYAGRANKNRYILKGGRLHPLPMGPLPFLKTPLFSLPAKLGLAMEPLIPRRINSRDEESLAAFVRRRLGREFLHYAVDPFVSGVFAGRPEELSVQWAFPKLYALEQNYGGLIRGAIEGRRQRRERAETARDRAPMFSFDGGMSTLVETLGTSLADVIETTVEVTSIARGEGGYTVNYVQSGEAKTLTANQLVLAVPAHVYDHLPFPLPDLVRSAFDQIQYAQVSVVYWGFKENPSSRPLDGFGFLVPRREQRQILGTIWNSSIFEGRAPQGGAAFTTFVGGRRQPHLALRPQDEIEELVRRELADILGITRAPDVLHFRRWHRAIPQYDMNYGPLIRTIESFEESRSGLHLIGNWRGGISVADCIKNGYVTAREMTAR